MKIPTSASGEPPPGIFERLSSLSAARADALCVALTALAATADYFTTAEALMTALYAVTVALGTSVVSGRFGAGLSLVSAAIFLALSLVGRGPGHGRLDLAI